jgi:predicted DNA-binding protein (UPF0251 family)
VGWKRITVPIKQMVPVFEHFEIQDEEQAELLKQAIAAKEEDPRSFEEHAEPAIKEAIKLYEEQGVMTYAVQSGEQEVTIDKVLENRPTVEVCNPTNVFFDPSCQGDALKALFAIQSFETNQADLKKEGKRYKNLDKVHWENNAPIMEPDHATKTPSDFNFSDPMRKRVVAYEYWGLYDIHGTGTLVPIVCTWIGDTIIRMEENPFPDQAIPFVIIPYLPVKRDLYGEADAELLEENQQILGAVTRGMIDLLGRSANGQRGMQKGMLDALNRRRYENGDDYEFNPTTHPSAGVVEHKYPDIPQSALLMLNLQNQEAEALTGVKSFSGGMSGEAYGDVAAGIRGVMDAASKREMAILRRLAKGMTDIGRKFISMNGAFLSEEEVVRVTNNEFVVVKREELAGDFDLETDISTVEVDNAKAQDMAFMLQTIGPKMPDLAQLIMADLCDLKRMPELAHRVRTFKAEPSPEQQQMQQLEIEKAQMEVAKLKSEVELNQAKAQQALALKDKTNLDYVENESGTTHARELEKQQAQSRGNQNLAVTKAIATPKKEGEKQPDVEAAIGFNAMSDDLERMGGRNPQLSPAPLMQ